MMIIVIDLAAAPALHDSGQEKESWTKKNSFRSQIHSSVQQLLYSQEYIAYSKIQIIQVISHAVI